MNQRTILVDASCRPINGAWTPLFTKARTEPLNSIELYGRRSRTRNALLATRRLVPCKEVAHGRHTVEQISQAILVELGPDAMMIPQEGLAKGWR